MVSPWTFLKTFAALIVLLAATVAVNYVDLGAYSVVAGLAISMVKALLIGLFFMEVRYSKPLTWLFAGAAFAWLLIMLCLTMNDYNSRPWSKQTWKQGQGVPLLHMKFPK